MISNRERLKPVEILRYLFKNTSENNKSGLERYLPLDGRFSFFVNQGKTAFEQIVLAANLENKKIMLPAFFPDDFVGIFLKYNITPIFVDVNKDSYHINLEEISEEHLAQVKAIILLHTFGLPADGLQFRNLCDEHNLILIEDCARALGATYSGKLVGSFGHYAIFSLPKCTPVPQGGICLSEVPFQPHLKNAKIDLSKILQALVLIKWPLLSILEKPAYKLLADSIAYPGELGNYNPLPSREFDQLGRFILKSYAPRYHKTLQGKKKIAEHLVSNLEPIGFRFQSTENHIFTSLSAEPPPDCEPQKLQVYLYKNGIKLSNMWRNALGISEFAHKTWKTDPFKFPNTMHLSKRLIQFPINRFQTQKESQRIITLCKQYLAKI